jgi:single-stranded-DNA-specific exonuclease
LLFFERRKTEFFEASERILGVSEPLQALLNARGINGAAEAEAFLNPCSFPLHSPYLLNDMEKAVSRIRLAIEKSERIAVYGDYDADGVCATSILFLCLKELGADVMYHIPNRHAEGYGMNEAAVKKLSDEGVKLIVTVDNGIKSLLETELSYSLGMEVIVTDHHRCGESLPNCAALVCTAAPMNGYPNADLCGAGIAYKLAQALMGDAAEKYLALAGLATVADVVPLLGENRALVARTLAVLNKGQGPVGLQALLKAANAKRVNAHALAFLAAPRLNAAGRLADASLAVELLTCTGQEEDRAQELAQKLNALNDRRKKEEQGILESAYQMADGKNLTDARAVVLKSETWNSGVVGIAAARVAERYYRPAVLFSEKDGLLTGSARSIPGVDLHAALKRCESLFERFGGHAYAAGVTMREENFEAFSEAFEQALRETADDSLFLPRKSYELELPFSKVNMMLAEEIERLEPFGEGNPEPLIRTDGVRVVNPKRIGSEGTHLSASLENEGVFLNGVAFGMGDRLSIVLDADRVDLLFTPRIDDFWGERAVKLYVSEMRPSPVAEVERYAAARGEKFIDAFSRNVLYNNMCGFRATVVSDVFETAASLTERSFAGVAVLCFTQRGAARFLRLARERNLLQAFDTRFHSNEKSACAYHALLLAPVLDELDLSRFQNIVVYDSAMSGGVLSRLNVLAPDAKLYVSPPDALDAQSLLNALMFDRDFVADNFRALKAADRTFYNRAAALDHLCAATGALRCRCALALDVLCELAFVTENKKGNLVFEPAAARRELLESETFRAVEALLQNHETYALKLKEEMQHGA